jgi:maltose O-acetyltransferase
LARLWLAAVPLKSLNQLRPLRLLVTGLRRRWLRWRTGLVIDASCSISLSARLRPHRPGGIVIGADTLIAFKTLIDARDLASGDIRPIRIGRRCFIGGGSMVMPGVAIGDGVIVAAGAVVMADVPGGCIVAGNPARIVRTGIDVGRFGRLAIADANSAAYHR